MRQPTRREVRFPATTGSRNPSTFWFRNPADYANVIVPLLQSRVGYGSRDRACRVRGWQFDNLMNRRTHTSYD